MKPETKKKIEELERIVGDLKASRVLDDAYIKDREAHITSLESVLKFAEEALEYYGSEKNWYSTNSTDLDKPEIKMVIASLDTEGKNWLGGRTARKALQTIRAMRGEDKG